MKIAVISPYWGEELSVIRRCHESVKSQTIPVTHVLVADGHRVTNGGHYVEIDEWDAEHIVIDRHGDFGDTPRGVGTAWAYLNGFDAIMWLDSDNWLEPTHAETMANALGTNAFVTTTRNLYYPDGELLGPCSESNGNQFNDTNCYLVSRRAMLKAPWCSKPVDPHIGDRYIWEVLKNTFPDRVHIDSKTVNYTTTIAAHYLQYGVEPPREAKHIVRLGDQWQVIPYWK